MSRFRRLAAAMAMVSALAVAAPAAAMPLLGLPHVWEWAQDLVTERVAIWAPSGGHSDPDGSPVPVPATPGEGDVVTPQGGGHSDPDG